MFFGFSIFLNFCFYNNLCFGFPQFNHETLDKIDLYKEIYLFFELQVHFLSDPQQKKVK